jgi:hypothetical protein
MLTNNAHRLDDIEMTDTDHDVQILQALQDLRQQSAGITVLALRDSLPRMPRATLDARLVKMFRDGVVVAMVSNAAKDSPEQLSAVSYSGKKIAVVTLRAGYQPGHAKVSFSLSIPKNDFGDWHGNGLPTVAETIHDIQQTYKGVRATTRELSRDVRFTFTGEFRHVRPLWQLYKA